MFPKTVNCVTIDDIIEYAEAIMGENYTEQLIRQKATSQTKLKRLALIAVFSVLLTATFAIPMMFTLTFAYALFLIYIWKRFMLITVAFMPSQGR